MRLKLCWFFLIFIIPNTAFSLVNKEADNLIKAKKIAEVKGYVSLWSQDCSLKYCNLPLPIEINVPVNLLLNIPSTPSSAEMKVFEKKFKLQEGDISARILFFVLFPPEGEVFYQVQVELKGIVKSFCSASLNEDDFLPSPVFMCAGYKNDTQRIGVTLHRNEFSKVKDFSKDINDIKVLSDFPQVESGKTQDVLNRFDWVLK